VKSLLKKQREEVASTIVEVAVTDDAPLTSESPKPFEEYVWCPECGCETAFAVISQFSVYGCLCPECQHVWTMTTTH